MQEASQSETITIVDDETIGAVSLSSSASSTAENGSNITITASITTPSEEDVVVNLSAGGTATSGTDYAAISSITILQDRHQVQLRLTQQMIVFMMDQMKQQFSR